MAVNNPNSGAVSTASQSFAGEKTFEPLNITGISGFSGFSGVSTGVGSVKMATGNAGTNVAWIPMKFEGVTYYLPGWVNFAP